VVKYAISDSTAGDAFVPPTTAYYYYYAFAGETTIPEYTD